MSKDIDPTELQIAQLTLALETTQHLLKGCPQYIQETVETVLKSHILLLRTQLTPPRKTSDEG